MTLRTYRHRRTGRPIAEARVVAHHEAGHIVVGRALGIRTGSAAIGDDGDGFTEFSSRSIEWIDAYVDLHVAARDASASRVTLRPPRRVSARQRELVRAYVVSSWGGIVAESILLGGRPSQRWSGADYSDRLDAMGASWILGFGPRAAVAYVESLRDDARRILVERWQEVEAIARSLQRRSWGWRQLKGAEIARVIRSSSPASRKGAAASRSQS